MRRALLLVALLATLAALVAVGWRVRLERQLDAIAQQHDARPPPLFRARRTATADCVLAEEAALALQQLGDLKSWDRRALTAYAESRDADTAREVYPALAMHEPAVQRLLDTSTCMRWGEAGELDLERLQDVAMLARANIAMLADTGMYDGALRWLLDVWGFGLDLQGTGRVDGIERGAIFTAAAMESYEQILESGRLPRDQVARAEPALAQLAREAPALETVIVLEGWAQEDALLARRSDVGASALLRTLRAHRAHVEALQEAAARTDASWIEAVEAVEEAAPAAMPSPLAATLRRLAHDAVRSQALAFGTAILRYRLERGSCPADLEALTGEVTFEAPVDLVTRGPLQIEGCTVRGADGEVEIAIGDLP